MPMEKFLVIKQNPAGEETWRYAGKLIERGNNYLVIEAFFDREDMNFFGMQLCTGDRFLETYYFDRWYNIFEIYDRKDGNLKGWYCNICNPAVEERGTVIYKDLALDLLVFPDGSQIVLDQDEFEKLNLTPKEKNFALEALKELKENFNQKIRAIE